MDYIKGREKYIIESYIENINESKLYLTPELRIKLGRIGDGISKSLLDLEFKDSGEDITFLSLSGNDRMLSFSRLDKVGDDIPRINNKELDEFTKAELDFLWSLNKRKTKDYWGIKKNKRINIKIGKIINKLFPGKFTDKQIEEFVNKFKGHRQHESTYFKIVSGEDIINFYRCDVEGGELGKSCMQNEPESYFEIYSKNPGSCELLALLDKNDDELLGRALIWRIDEFLNYEDQVNTGELDFGFFMDRVYTTQDKYKETFYEYCRKKGWGKRGGTGIYDHNIVSYNNRLYYDIEMKVQLDYIPTKFPYMDTFKSLDPDEDVLYNFETSNLNELWLEETDGKFYSLVPKSFVEIGSHKGELVEKRYTYKYKGKVVHQDDVIYVHESGGVILKENAVQCISYTNQLNGISSFRYYDKTEGGKIIKIDEISNTLWYRIIKKKWESEMNNFRLKLEDIHGLFETAILYKKDFKGDYILITDSISTTKAENGEWYLPTELELFNIKIDKSGKQRIESLMEYYYRVWYGTNDVYLNPINVKLSEKYEQFDKYIKNM